MKKLAVTIFLLLFVSCTSEPKMEEEVSEGFGKDLEFLKAHTDVVLLSDESNEIQVAVVPAWQGRVMTSTSAGKNGVSFGWINYELIESGELQPHINVFGGEDRFWMGPEGGQYAIFFKEGDPFDLEHWQTPAFIDTDAYTVVSKTKTEVVFEHEEVVKNYSGTEFPLKIHRTVRILSQDKMSEILGLETSGLKNAAFESVNVVTNTGDTAWEKENGLLSIWILGMYNPSPKTTAVIPFREGPEEDLGPAVNDDYFGEISPDRLRVGDDVLFFKCDGESRGKIGISPKRAKPFSGSWDEINQVLTIVHFNLPEQPLEYVNSMWELQEKPFAGDAVNSYNDGPPEPGVKPLGPFYELETSSPALTLSPGDKYIHYHRTIHFSGDREKLDQVAQTVLGVGIDEIEEAFE